MYDAINIEMFEWALAVQSLVKEGWTFSDLDYGEPRFSIRPKITLSKGKFKTEIDGPIDYEKIEKLREAANTADSGE